MITRTSRRYSGVAMALHWLIAVLIVLNFVSVWVSEGMARPERMQVMANHKAFGITILILSVVRILWRITHRPPPLLPNVRGWEATLATAVHALFYILMIGIPFTGWAMASGYGPVKMFGLFSMPALPVPTDKASVGLFHATHEKLATVMLVLLGLHVLGALKHHFLDGDRSLGRMIPFLRAPG